MMMKSSLMMGLLCLAMFAGCDWCKKCKEESAEKAKTEETAQQAATTPVEEKAASAIITIKNKENFETEVLKSDKLVIVDFHSTFCETCKKMLPVFEEIAKTMQDKCKFVTISKEDAEADLFTSKNVQGVPTFIIYKDGEEQTRFIGEMYKEDLTKHIEESLEDHE